MNTIDMKRKTSIKTIKIANLILVLVIYKISLDLVYKYTISYFYRYQGFNDLFSISRSIISYLVLIIMSLLIHHTFNKSKPSKLILLMLNLIYFIPGLTLYSFGNMKHKYFILFILYWYLIMQWDYIIPIFYSKRKSTSKWPFYSIVGAIIIMAIFISGYYNNFNLHFSLTDVYDLRMEQRSLHLPSIVGYIQPLSVVVIPIALVYFLMKHKYLISTALILTQLLLFGFGGSKFTLFSIFIALGSYFYYRSGKDKMMIYGLIIINFVSLLESYFNGGYSYISAYIQRRIFFMPNLLSVQYHDFFQKNELLYLRSSILNRFGFENPYNAPIARIIGLNYYGNIENNANNGMIGDAYANFGIFGILLYPLIIVVLLKVMDGVSKGIDSKVLVAVCVLYAIAFTNASLFPLLLTNGFLFMIIFLYLYPRGE